MRRSVYNGCGGSYVGVGQLQAKAVLQQSYAFTWISCGERSQTVYGSSLAPRALNDLGCSTSPTHYWRTLSTHGGLVGTTNFDMNHFPLVSPVTAA